MAAAAILAVGTAALLLGASQATTTPSRYVTKPCDATGCHDDLKRDEFLHGPVVVNACQTCHELADEVEHTFRDAAEEPKLCLDCHEIRHRRPVLHEPLTRGKCLCCHDPHGGFSRYLLRGTSEIQMCLGCHYETIVLRGEVHDPIIEEQCLGCHRGHNGRDQKLLRDQAGEPCLRCHQDDLDRFAQMPRLHEPVLEYDCGGCHDSHASEVSHLLAKFYTAELYAPYDEQLYELCFSCHEKTLVEAEMTADATQFRNGRQNLHFLHVCKPRRGRTCQACHPTHSYDNAQGIRRDLVIGNWGVDLRFAAWTTGGYCGPSCHSAKAYDRIRPVDYDKEPKPSTTRPGDER